MNITSTDNLFRHRIGVALGGVGLALVLAACGDSDTGDTATQSGDEGPPTIEVVGDDYLFDGLPDTIEAGTKLTFRNVADEELHEVVAIRLPDDETRTVGELFALPPEEFPEVPPSAVIIAEAGQTGQVIVGDGVLTEPGRYVFFCAIPVGADPQEYLTAAATSDGPPDVAGGPPHFVEGMVAEVTVTEG